MRSDWQISKLDDIQKRLYKLDIQDRAVKESTHLYNDRSMGKDAFAGHGNNRGIMLNSGIAVLPLAYFPPLSLSKLATYSVSIIHYAIDQIRAFVNPANCDTALIRTLKVQEDGTTAWLLGNTIFEQWKAPCEYVMQQVVSAQKFFSENTF